MFVSSDLKAIKDWQEQCAETSVNGDPGQGKTAGAVAEADGLHQGGGIVTL